MKQEVFTAVAVGLGLGILIAAGVFGLRSYFQKVQKPSEISTPLPAEEISPPTSTPLSSPSLNLNLISPNNEEVFTVKEASVSGQTAASATVVISTNLEDKIASADANGNFHQTITLEEGANEIMIVAYDNEGNEVVKSINIIYAPEE